MSLNGEIQDILPPVAVYFALQEVILFLGALLLLGCGLWYCFCRCRKAPDDLPQRSLQEDIEQEFNVLEKQISGPPDVFYQRLVLLLRTYFARIFKWSYAELTSDELLVMLRNSGVVPPHLADRLSEVLAAADLSRFAGCSKSSQELLDDLNAAREIICLCARFSGKGDAP